MTPVALPQEEIVDLHNEIVALEIDNAKKIATLEQLLWRTQKLLLKSPRDVRVLITAAMAYMKLGKQKKAKEQFLKAFNLRVAQNLSITDRINLLTSANHLFLTKEIEILLEELFLLLHNEQHEKNIYAKNILGALLLLGRWNDFYDMAQEIQLEDITPFTCTNSHPIISEVLKNHMGIIQSHIQDIVCGTGFFLIVDEGVPSIVVRLWLACNFYDSLSISDKCHDDLDEYDNSIGIKISSLPYDITPIFSIIPVFHFEPALCQ
ncbi:hypothetical protein CCP2SC5_80050 [Azospirillaceae bacterium]